MAATKTMPTTNRAYTLELSGKGHWRELLWTTHVTVNRGAHLWGDWLLSLRGGLPASLADDESILPVTDAHVTNERRRRGLAADGEAIVRAELESDRRRNLKVVLALSWLSVESPASLAPQLHIVARAIDKPADRKQRVMERFGEIINRLNVSDKQEWRLACEAALSSRIRDDAVWVDRSACFCELQQRFQGLNVEWTESTLLDFLGGKDDYFTLPDVESAATAEAKEFVKKAGRWLSRNWGSGDKSDPAAICESLARLAAVDAPTIIGTHGSARLALLLGALGQAFPPNANSKKLFQQLKQAIGWKGSPSKGARALERLRDAVVVTADLWAETVAKLKEEQAAKGNGTADCPSWLSMWRDSMESLLRMPYHPSRDLTWEYGVILDHSLRRVSGAHTWIKRAESRRRQFREDAAKLDDVPRAACEWLDTFGERRAAASGALDEYIIRERAIDGWDKVVQAWDDLGSDSTREDRIEAARQVQANLGDNEKFGDIQLFAGFGRDHDEHPQPCLADDDAICVWHDAHGRPDADILTIYVRATAARHDERRFKVPAYRHPDPLRRPIYVDFGNSRWGITFASLKAARDRQKRLEKLSAAKTEITRTKLRERLGVIPDLHVVTLDLWNGEAIERLSLRWHAKRLSKDLDLGHFGQPQTGAPVTRADRLGRIIANHTNDAAVNIAGVFEQSHWNARLQVPREQLEQLANLVYGKRAEPDYASLNQVDRMHRARRCWEQLKWFLTTSARLRPHGPWLDYVAGGLPDGIEYKNKKPKNPRFSSEKHGSRGWYVDHAENKERKGRARLGMARLPGLRVLSVDLGHRYAAACAVWETLTSAQMADACIAAGRSAPSGNDLYIHLRMQTAKIQKSGRNKGQPVMETKVYRRIGPDVLTDGSAHAAPWARLERQFLIKLQGEERPARKARRGELEEFERLRRFLGLAPMADIPRVDELQRDAVRVARLGLRRLADAAMIAFSLAATHKPGAGGRVSELSHQQRIAYVQEGLLRWQELGGSSRHRDDWAQEMWQTWIVGKLGGPPPGDLGDDAPQPERKKKREATLASLRRVAEQLSDPQSESATQLHRLWSDHWLARKNQWHGHLRWLRRLILPRKCDLRQDTRVIRRVGGLSLKRLKTIRELYQVLKAFRMRPEPDDLRKNVPELGDESMANFGRRILGQLERLREQRIKQLASRTVEAALGAGRIKKPSGRERKRPAKSVDRPCHVVVIENLEHYKPEDSRLRRENRQLMDWAARNVRKYLLEGCELHGLHFFEVSPNYTSRQDSRTGAPGVRCEDVPRHILEEAARRVSRSTDTESDSSPGKRQKQFEWQVHRWVTDLNRINRSPCDLSPRDRLLAAVVDALPNMPASRESIRLPRRGGELFVSATDDSPVSAGLQADLNAAANIGLKALADPDWIGSWWFILVAAATGKPVAEKVRGCPLWHSGPGLWASSGADAAGRVDTRGAKHRLREARKSRTEVYAWNPLLGGTGHYHTWLATQEYWDAVERQVAWRLQLEQTETSSPF